MDNRPVSFPQWKQVLVAAALAPSQAAAYQREIITFLKHCKTQHVPATVLLAKDYVEKQEQLRTEPVREALRWFYRAAKGLPANRALPAVEGAGPAAQPRSVHPKLMERRVLPPPKAADDLGDSLLEPAGTSREQGWRAWRCPMNPSPVVRRISRPSAWRFPQADR